jgi:hypothetical protein
VAERRKARLLAVAVLAVGGAAAAGYVVSHPGDADRISTVADPWTPTGTAAVSPPPANPEDVATDTATPASAALQITYSGPDEAAGGVVVGAYVAGLIEEGGRCAMTMSLDGASASTDSEGLADASTTSCGQLLVPFSELSPGSWTVDVTYSSPTGKAVAPGRTTVEVPR